MDDKLKILIREYNPWWEDRGFTLPEFKRSVFFDLIKFLEPKQILALVGLRRVGKTILLKQLLSSVLESSVKKNVFYFAFDDFLVQNPLVLQDVLDYFLKTIAVDGRKYVFLDEVQKVDYWQDFVKRVYDSRDDVKFVVSGSASLDLKKSKESLAGRLFDFFIPVLSFSEFLELNGVSGISRPGLDFNELKAVYENNIHKQTELSEFFLDYLARGAFPEIAVVQDKAVVEAYIKNSVIEKIVFEDIPIVFKVRRKEILYSLLEYCSRETSNLLDLFNLSKTFSVNYLTLRSYLFFLQHSFLVDLQFNYSKNLSKQLRKSKKIHVAHPCITASFLHYSKTDAGFQEIAGRLVESMVFQHSRLLGEKIFFYRTPQKEEIDLILDALPVEVKYSSSIGYSDYAFLIKFLKQENLSTGIVVTKNVFEEKTADGKKIWLIPAWLYLLAKK